ncbi:MAG: hypothetical protein VB118_11650 [Oscillospiraceae bacterium]|nr:hypothetical protein [Oscillospiraceae bacterium]
MQIGERLLAESTDAQIRSGAIYTLCNACVMKKDIENAKKYADMMPSYIYSKEILYGRCLFGEERLKYRQNCIVEFIRTIYSIFIQDLYGVAGIGNPCDCLPKSYTAKICEFALGLFKLLYPDSDYGDDERWVAAICNVLTNQYSGDDNNKSLYYLEETVNHYVKYYTQSKFKHTSFTVDRLTCPGFTGSKDVMQRCVAQDLSAIEDVQDLEPIRNDARYAVAVGKLKALLK